MLPISSNVTIARSVGLNPPRNGKGHKALKDGAGSLAGLFSLHVPKVPGLYPSPVRDAQVMIDLPGFNKVVPS